MLRCELITSSGTSKRNRSIKIFVFFLDRGQLCGLYDPQLFLILVNAGHETEDDQLSMPLDL